MRQVDGDHHAKAERDAGQAEHLEGDPAIGGKVAPCPFIGGGDGGEHRNPDQRQVEPGPVGQFHGHGFTQQCLERIAPQHQPDQQARGNHQADHGGLDLDEGFIGKNQGQRTKQHHRPTAKRQNNRDFTGRNPRIPHRHQGRQHQHRGADVNPVKGIDDEKQHQRAVFNQHFLG